MTHSAEASYAVYWPRGERTLQARQVAPKVDTLQGKVVAFLWDYLFRGDEIFAMLRPALTQRYPGVVFIGPDEFGSTHGADEREVLARLPSRLKELRVDAVISGMGC